MKTLLEIVITMRLSQALLSIIFAAPATTVAFSSSLLSRSDRGYSSILPRSPTGGFSSANHDHSHHHPNRSINKSPLCASVAPIVNGEADTTAIPIIRLSVEEKAKTVISICTSGTLCTTSTQDGINGAPFGSFVDYVLDDGGNPILLMNEMSMHTLNIANDPDGMVTLFAQLGGKPTDSGSDGGAEPAPRGQDVSRCSITGSVEKIDQSDPDEDLSLVRMRYSITHVYADQVMDSPRFAFYRIRPKKVYFVGGFGVSAKWVPVEEYRDAAADILAEEATEIVAKLNRDHGSDLSLTASHILDCRDVEKVRVASVDRLGMDIRVTTRGKRKNKLNTDEFRIGFRIPVMSVEDAKSEVLKVFQEAWEKGNGYSWGEEEDDLPGSGIPILKVATDALGLNK